MSGIQPTPQPITAQQPTKPATKVGATWADTKGAINIDVDNLLAPRSPKAGIAPSINQLKSTPNSPAHKPAMPVMQPITPFMVNNNFLPHNNINNNTAFQNSNFLQ